MKVITDALDALWGERARIDAAIEALTALAPQRPAVEPRRAAGQPGSRAAGQPGSRAKAPRAPKPGGSDGEAKSPGSGRGSPRPEAEQIVAALMKGKSPREVADLLEVPYATTWSYRKQLVEQGKLQPLSRKKNEESEE